MRYVLYCKSFLYRKILRYALITVAAILVFILDTISSHEIAVCVFYAPLILFAPVTTVLAVISLASVFLVLMALSFVLSYGEDGLVGIVNTLFGFIIIVATAYLALKTAQAQKESRQAQAQIMRIARVKSLEGLSTSIAHELSQPLTAIFTSANAAQRWLQLAGPRSDKAQEALQRIQFDANRASHIVERVRSLTRAATPEKEIFDLNQATWEIIDLARIELKQRRINLQSHLHPSLPPVIAHKVQIQQVVSNLVLNAMEALEEVSEAKRSIIVTTQYNDPTLTLTVEDSGPGLNASELEHLFEVFWTSKANGMGIGLSLCRSIVEANGGHIVAHNSAAGGAIFTVTLPSVTPESL